VQHTSPPHSLLLPSTSSSFPHHINHLLSDKYPHWLAERTEALSN
jgi:hypothetical protein